MSFGHRTYPKIATAIGAAGRGREWVATEKVHGAQLVVATDGRDVRVGKRKQWLHEREAFFGWQLLRPELEAGARAVHAQLSRGGVVRLFGELFGGGYPHPDVPRVPGLSPVQSGVWYSPTLGFALFDVVLEVEADDDRTFLAHDEVVRLAEAAALMTTPVLVRGRRADVEAQPVSFQTRLPGLLGLPPIEGNLAEGYVVKHAAAMPSSERVIRKIKIPQFDDARFDEARPFDDAAHLTVDELARIAAILTNPARIASARSKVGEDPQNVIDEATVDVLVDLEAMFPRCMQALGDDEERLLHLRVGGLVRRATEAL